MMQYIQLQLQLQIKYTVPGFVIEGREHQLTTQLPSIRDKKALHKQTDRRTTSTSVGVVTNDTKLKQIKHPNPTTPALPTKSWKSYRHVTASKQACLKGTRGTGGGEGATHGGANFDVANEEAPAAPGGCHESMNVLRRLQRSPGLRQITYHWRHHMTRRTTYPLNTRDISVEHTAQHKTQSNK